jgi:hypothetical protein
VPVEEVERVEPDPDRHRRARRQRQDDASQHQRDQRRQLQAVDRPPPFAEGRALFTGEHGVSLKAKVGPLVAHGGFEEVNGIAIFWDGGGMASRKVVRSRMSPYRKIITVIPGHPPLRGPGIYRVKCQDAIAPFQGWPDLSTALAKTTRRRSTAMRASLGGLPLARSR